MDEIQSIYKDGFGVKASEELRAGKVAAAKRFHDAEAGVDGSGKRGLEAEQTMSSDTTPPHQAEP